jgi:hypothetical protein
MDYISIGSWKGPVVWQNKKASPKGLCGICPFCGDQHIHSVGSGHRSAHCKDKFHIPDITSQDGDVFRVFPGGYYVITVEL